MADKFEILKRYHQALAIESSQSHREKKTLGKSLKTSKVPLSMHVHGKKNNDEPISPSCNRHATELEIPCFEKEDTNSSKPKIAASCDETHSEACDQRTLARSPTRGTSEQKEFTISTTYHNDRANPPAITGNEEYSNRKENQGCSFSSKGVELVTTCQQKMCQDYKSDDGVRRHRKELPTRKDIRPKRRKSSLHFSQGSPASASTAANRTKHHLHETPSSESKGDGITACVLADLSLGQSRLRVVTYSGMAQNSIEGLPGMENSETEIKTPFPVVVHKMMNDVHALDPSIMRWEFDGEAFSVNPDHPNFSKVMGRYFHHNNYSSFQRQLNIYGWKKRRSGKYAGMFHHPGFHRDMSHQEKLWGMQRGCKTKQYCRKSTPSRTTPRRVSSVSSRTRKRRISSTFSLDDGKSKHDQMRPHRSHGKSIDNLLRVQSQYMVPIEVKKECDDEGSFPDHLYQPTVTARGESNYLKGFQFDYQGTMPTFVGKGEHTVIGSPVPSSNLLVYPQLTTKQWRKQAKRFPVCGSTTTTDELRTPTHQASSLDDIDLVCREDLSSYLFNPAALKRDPIFRSEWILSSPSNLPRSENLVGGLTPLVDAMDKESFLPLNQPIPLDYHAERRSNEKLHHSRMPTSKGGLSVSFSRCTPKFSPLRAKVLPAALADKKPAKETSNPQIQHTSNSPTKCSVVQANPIHPCGQPSKSTALLPSLKPDGPVDSAQVSPSETENIKDEVIRI